MSIYVHTAQKSTGTKRGTPMTRKARGERDIGVNVGGLDLIVPRRKVGNTGGRVQSSPVQSAL